MPGRIIVLNGTPRAGKSTLAKQIQDTFDGVWLNLGLDKFKKATPERYQPGIGLRPGAGMTDLEPLVRTLYLAMYQSIAAHSRLGINVVADTTHHDDYSQPLHILPTCARVLSGLPAMLVGVHCPIEVIMQRRQDTWGWSYDSDGTIPERILRWQSAVHEPGVYDLELDTSTLDAEAGARLIAARLVDPAPLTAFATLAASPYTR